MSCQCLNCFYSQQSQAFYHAVVPMENYFLYLSSIAFHCCGVSFKSSSTSRFPSSSVGVSNMCTERGLPLLSVDVSDPCAEMQKHSTHVNWNTSDISYQSLSGGIHVYLIINLPREISVITVTEIAYIFKYTLEFWENTEMRYVKYKIGPPRIQWIKVVFTGPTLLT